MRILMITGDFPPTTSGEANHAFFLAKHIAERGHQLRVITSRIKDVYKDDGFEVKPLMRNWSWWELPKLARAVERSRCDAILLMFLSEMYCYHPMMTFAPTVVRRVCPGTRFVTQFEHLGGFSWSRPFRMRLMRRMAAYACRSSTTDYEYGTLLRDSDRIIVLSDMHRAHLADRVPQVNEKHALIPPPPTMKVAPNCSKLRARVRQSLKIQSDEFALVFYGLVFPGKGVETLLSAIRLVVERRRKVRLLIVGGPLNYAFPTAKGQASRDYFEQMKTLSEQLGISKQVNWLGHCPPEEDAAGEYFRAGDAVVFSFDYGVHLNNSSFSAAAVHGLPIITTRVKTTEAAFQDRKNVVFVEQRSPESFAGAIELLMDQPRLTEQLREGISSMAREWFSWDRAVDRTVQALSE